MKVDKLSDLKKILLLCRQQGVTSIEVDNIKLQLGQVYAPKEAFPDLELPPEATIQVPKYTGDLKVDVHKIATDELTDDQLLFYSSRPEAPDFKETI